MTREEAQQIMRIAADTPAAISTNLTLLTVIDAVMTLYTTNDTEGMPAPLAALRKPKAAWRNVHAHAELRARQP